MSASYADLWDAVKRVESLLVETLDGCFCDDGDGNCNTLAPECRRCVTLREALGTLRGLDP